jgi:hypothetical protein
MLLVNHLTGFNVGGGIDPVGLSFVTSTSSTTDLSTYTFAGQSLGAEASDRKIVVAVGAARAAAFALNTVTVGGVTAYKLVEREDNDGASEATASLWIADIPTGTTGDVVVTFSAAAARCGVAIFRLTGSGPVSFTTLADGTDADPTGTIDVPANGGAIAVSYTNAATTTTWTGLTERNDTTMEGAFSSASDQFAALQEALTVTSNWVAPSNSVMAVASFGPADIPSRLFCGEAFSTTDLSTYTFSTEDIGPAHASRLVVVAVKANRNAVGANSVSSMTIGGVAATKAVDEGGADRFIVEIWYASVPTGTTGDVVVTFANAQTDCGVLVYALYNLRSTTPTDTGSGGAGSLTIDLPEYGQLVAIARDGSVTWTGATEDYDSPTESRTSASRGEVTAATGVTVSAGTLEIVAAVWR